MPAPAAALPPSELSLDPCALGESILRHEAAALAALADSLIGGPLAEDFRRATRLLLACRGSVIVSGMGKAGLVGQKICATLASTGTRSHFLHPGEAVHGDLGRVHADDLVLMLSYSGRTEEVVRLLPLLAEMQVPVLAMTGRRQSPLGQAAAVLLHVDVLGEACPLGLAPSTSTTAMLALGDALALVVSRARGFTADDFARYHPGGSLGLALTSVEQAMRPVAECRVAREDERLREALVSHRKPGRRSGAIMVVDAGGRLAGIFTDSDLARLLEQGRDAQLDGPMSQVMTRGPATVIGHARLRRLRNPEPTEDQRTAGRRRRGSAARYAGHHGSRRRDACRGFQVSGFRIQARAKAPRVRNGSDHPPKVARAGRRGVKEVECRMSNVECRMNTDCIPQLTTD
jgi:arabinose-5-phosphate isomerase